ncbi:MAG TPA: helix-turn-helix domain-containing protein [Myxococcota bacterium]|nr:helix-turn-helix domain-containing protein [Myxococcota bacterium]
MAVKPDRRKMGAQLAAELVADKWFIRIVHQLEDGTKRYGELRRNLPSVSQRMLTRTLRNIERDGLVSRKVYAVVPPKTEYALTELGQSLIEPLHGLCQWAERHFPRVQAHRLRDAGRPKGAP